MLKIIDEHNASFDPEHLRDLIDVYISEVKEREIPKRNSKVI